LKPSALIPLLVTHASVLGTHHSLLVTLLVSYPAACVSLPAAGERNGFSPRSTGGVHGCGRGVSENPRPAPAPVHVRAGRSVLPCRQAHARWQSLRRARSGTRPPDRAALAPTY